MQIRKRKASRRVKLSMNKFVSFSAEGKFSVEINTERLHTVPRTLRVLFVLAVFGPYLFVRYMLFVGGAVA